MTAPGTSDYRQAWQEYRKRRNQFWLAFAGYVPVCSIVAIVSEKVLHTLTPGFVVAPVWMILVLVARYRAESWRCPRCGKAFSATWWYRLGFLARRCVHCGLRKYDKGIRPLASTGGGDRDTRTRFPPTA